MGFRTDQSVLDQFIATITEYDANPLTTAALAWLNQLYQQGICHSLEISMCSVFGIDPHNLRSQ